MPLRTTTPAGHGDDHPYAQVRTADGCVGWVSGVLPYDEDGRVVGDRDDAVRHSLRVLAERLADAGAALDDVVKITVYLTDLSWRDAVNDAFRRTFRPPLPARTVVEVRALPRGAGIELDAVVQVAP